MHLCTTLVSCELCSCWELDETILSPPITSHSKSLTCGNFVLDSDEVNLSVLFEGLTLPAIHKLKIDTYVFPRWSWPHLSFVAFLSRSSHSLRQLHLQHIHVPTLTLLEYLPLTPLLAELCFEFIVDPDNGSCPVNNRFVDALTYPSSPHDDHQLVLFPELRNLRHLGPLPFDDHKMADMVQSRWRLDCRGIVVCRV